MMSAKMGTVNDEDMIRMAFRVLDKDGRGTIKSSAFKHLMTHIGKFYSTQPEHLMFGTLDFFWTQVDLGSDLRARMYVTEVVESKLIPFSQADNQFFLGPCLLCCLFVLQTKIFPACSFELASFLHVTSLREALI